MLLILIVLELDIFQKKGKYLVASNIFKIQAYDSIMCGYFCIGFIAFMFAGKALTEFTNVFLQNNFKRNGDIILNS